MELGQKLCLARNPLCEKCPFSTGCVSCAEGTQNRVPRKKRKSIYRFESRVLVIVGGDSLLVEKNGGTLFRGLYTLPVLQEGGTGQNIEAYVRERYKLQTKVLTHLKPRVHHYTTNQERLLPVLLGSIKGRVPRGEKVFWFSLDKLEELGFPSVYRKIIREAEERLRVGVGRNEKKRRHSTPDQRRGKSTSEGTR